MIKSVKNTANFTKKRLLLIFGALIFTLLVAFGTYKLLDPQPSNLGEKLQYIGKKDFGCAPFPFFFFCSYKPYSDYYFATDMSKDEIGSYFKKAMIIRSERINTPQVSKEFERTEIGFESKEQATQSFFSIKYFNHPEKILQAYHLKDTGRLYIISILDSEYMAAKSAL